MPPWLRLARIYVPVGIVLALPLLCFDFRGTSDVDIWLDGWVPLSQRYGLVKAYTKAHEDYPPLGFAVTSLVGFVSQRTGSDAFVVLKVVLFLFLLANTVVTALVTRSTWGALAMHLALTVNVMMHGYLDICFAPFLLASAYFIGRDQPAAGAVCFFFAGMMKYQPLIVAPFWVLHVVLRGLEQASWQATAKKLVVTVVLPVLGLVLATRLIFGPWTFGSLFATTTQHHWLSANALNVNWLVASAIKPENPLRVGINAVPWWSLPARCLVVAGYGYALLGYWKSRRDLASCLLWACVGFLAYFTFNYGVHENHLFLVGVLCVFLAIGDLSRFKLLVYWPVAACVNEILFYGFRGAGFELERRVLGVDLTVPCALLNVVMFFVTAALAWRMCARAELDVPRVV
jgi:hypothetical protein